jgi:riboflavin biosynthesis pyrimidine reductase
MRLLYPECRSTSPQELASGLRLGDKAPPDRPYLVLNMVSSLDGKATIDWRTKGLSTELDRQLFHRLRTQADAIMVGAGTIRAERYGRMAKSDELRDARVEEGLEPDPLAVVISAEVIYERTGDDLQLLMSRLREQHGVRSIVCEGGPTLNSYLLVAGVVDELWLTLNPKVAGGAAALTIVAGEELVDPTELEPVSVAEGDGDLFTRWRVKR